MQTVTSAFDLWLASLAATVVWPETSPPSQTAGGPQRVIQLSVLSTIPALRQVRV